MGFLIRSGNTYLHAAPFVPSTYFYVTPAASSSTATTKLKAIGSPVAISLQYKIDNGDWSEYTVGTEITLTAGQKAYFKGNNDHFSLDANNWYQFDTTIGQIDIGGDLTSLLSESGNVLDISGYGFRLFNQLFRNQVAGTANVIDASALVLPSTTLGEYSYSNLFAGNGSNGLNTLVTPPVSLPATTIAPYAYNYMFNGCQSMTSLPEMHLVTVDTFGCKNMFNRCGSLNVLPDLSNVTSVGAGGFSSMFGFCSLIKMSATQEGEYTNAFTFGITPDSTTAANMFRNSGGTFTGTPTQQTYYTSNTIV